MTSPTIEITQFKEYIQFQKDWLKKELNGPSDAGTRVDLLLQLADLTIWDDLEHSAALLEEARSLAAASQYKAGLAHSLVELARLNRFRSEFGPVINLCSEAIEILKGHATTPILAKAYLQLAWVQVHLGEYAQAMQWALQGQDIAKRLAAENADQNLTVVAIQLEDVIASILSEMDNHVEALNLHRRAETGARACADLHLLTTILNNYSFSLMRAGELEKALKIGNETWQIASQVGIHLYRFADTLGEIYLAMGRNEEANIVIEESYNLVQAVPQPFARVFLLRNMGRVRLVQNRLAESIDFLNQARTLMEQLHLRGSLPGCYLLLSQAYEKAGDYLQALEHFRTFYKLEETIRGRESTRKLSLMQSNYSLQIAERDAEIERLRNQELEAEIAERKALQASLEHLAATDSLTGLTNRHHFFILAQREVERALRYNSPLVLLMLDIDEFKRINDSMGHIIGDQVLASLGRFILSTLRDVDIAGRYGGEEFVVLLPETQIESAGIVAERLRTKVENAPFATDQGTFYITVSIGISSLSRPESKQAGENTSSRSLAAMLNRADQALYMAKKSGRNKTVALS